MLTVTAREGAGQGLLAAGATGRRRQLPLPPVLSRGRGGGERCSRRGEESPGRGESRVGRGLGEAAGHCSERTRGSCGGCSGGSSLLRVPRPPTLRVAVVVVAAAEAPAAISLLLRSGARTPRHRARRRPRSGERGRAGRGRARGCSLALAVGPRGSDVIDV